MNFKDWLFENTNLEYWGSYSRVDDIGESLVIRADELSEPLYLSKSSSFTYIDKWPVGKNLSPPWNKYFQYIKDSSGRNIVTYTENRAVDVVCYNKSNNAVYLINRNHKPTGLALPGGFFDNDEDGFDANNPPEPSRIGRIAAARELKEETRANVNPNELSYIGQFLTGSSDTREKTFKVWAYSYIVPDDKMTYFKYGDDASQAPGNIGIKGWYSLENIPNLAFDHHKEIISKISID